MENDHVVATGDDNGLIKIWDLRQAQAGVKKSCAMELNEHEQSITGLNYVQDKNMLLSVANDGMLGVWDLRTGKLHAMSDSLEEDLSAVCLMRDGKKVITSTSEGIINIFSWDWFGDCNDRITGHPNAIETMIKYDENLVITGCEDGLMRAVSVLPNRIVAILGDPMEEGDDVFGIHKLTLSHDK
jgi:WD40 repeat protein